MPQRERVTFLAHLVQRLSDLPGTAASFGFVDLQPILHLTVTGPVIVPEETAGLPTPKTSLSVGCTYDRRSGAWWFVWHHSGEGIAPANELVAAANTIRSEMSQVKQAVA